MFLDTQSKLKFKIGQKFHEKGRSQFIFLTYEMCNFFKAYYLSREKEGLPFNATVSVRLLLVNISNRNLKIVKT